MKILFICGGLAPGKNGVGDYSRRLGAELVKRGHQVQLLSVNDPECADVREDNQSCDGMELKALCLPRNISWSERLKIAKAYVEAFDPDWVSLQFVCYSFHPKGLCFGIGKFIRSIIGERKLHLMVHELWIGMLNHYTLKHQILGWFQKLAVLMSLRTTGAEVIHTQTDFYLHVLNKNGVAASFLPLFSNIPVIDYERQGGCRSSSTMVFCAGIFGSLAEGRLPFVELEKLNQLVRSTGMSLVVYSAGRLGDMDKQEWRRVSEMLPDVTFNILGDLSANEVSEFLSSLDLAIAAVPLVQLQKSGCVAAYVEHDLPVLIPDYGMADRAGFQYKPIDSRFVTIDHLDLELITSLNRNPSSMLSDVATVFENTLLV